MRRSILVLIVAALFFAGPAVAVVWESERHDCDGDDPENHSAETFQGALADGDSCVAVNLGDPSIDCIHQYAPNVWVALNLDRSADGAGCLTNEIACATYWCPSGSGWTLQGFGLRPDQCDEADAQIHATGSGIACFRDGDGDDRYTPNSGDVLYNFAGCS